MKTFTQKLKNNIKKKKSYICIGLDTDYDKLPIKTNNVIASMLAFNKKIIDSTSDVTICYKINSAFYEKHGPKGIELLKKSIEYIHSKKDDIPVILDAKRCDIGNSSKYYAQFAFDYLKADSITVLPYMGIDAIEPFFAYKKKLIIPVIVSSNPGGSDFQMYPPKSPLYLKIIRELNKKFTNVGFVFGATKPSYIQNIRKKKINNILLIPGLGTQKGDAEKTIKYSLMNNGIGIFNFSRAIIYAGKGKNYAQTVRAKALEYYKLIQKLI